MKCPSCRHGNLQAYNSFILGQCLQCRICGTYYPPNFEQHEAAKQALKDVQAVEARLDTLKRL